MLVAIDIGNTNITMGVIDNNQLLGRYRMISKVRRTSDEFGGMLQTFANSAHIQLEEIEDVIITSVVPKIMHSVVSGVIKFFGIEPIVVQPGIKSGISVQLENPKSVGADRIADCAGA